MSWNSWASRWHWWGSPPKISEEELCGLKDFWAGDTPGGGSSHPLPLSLVGTTLNLC